MTCHCNGDIDDIICLDLEEDIIAWTQVCTHCPNDEDDF